MIHRGCSGVSDRRVIVSIVTLLVAAVGTPARAGAAADPTLAPYAALVRSPAGTALLRRARAAMEHHWAPAEPDRRRPAVATPDSVPSVAWPAAPVGVYLSLVRGRATRACIGREGASFATLSDAVEALAVEVLTADRRRPPLRHEDLAALRVVVSFAGEGEPIADPMLADPGREGLSIATPRGVVAFLPGEARTVAWALRESRRIGVLDGAVSSASYRRFPVVVLSEPEVPSLPEGDTR